MSILIIPIRLGYNSYQTEKNQVDWSRNLATDMENLLDTGTLTDVTIKCDKKTIKCHKAVLSARSAVFRAMFNHDMRENKNNEIVITVTKTQIIIQSGMISIIVRIWTLVQSQTWSSSSTAAV